MIGEQEGDQQLIEQLLALLAADKVDYTIFWRALSRFVAACATAPPGDLFVDRGAFDIWLAHYQRRTASQHRATTGESMLATNPKFVLRNHLGEQAIQSARSKDFSEVARVLHLLERPFDEHPECESYAGFPPDWASGIAISCSS